MALGHGEREQARLRLLLSAIDSPAMGLACGAGFRRFTSLTLEERQRVLRAWRDSPIPAMRTGFLALRKIALLTYYILPSADDGPNPVWRAIGYPGPPGPAAVQRPRRIAPLRIDRDCTLSCDVCIVGSGAGGGTAAGVLAAAGLDVVVIEAGGQYEQADFDGAEHGGYARMYMGAGAAASEDQSVGLIAGWCLGGGTVVNFTTSFRPPDEVREEWASHGVAAFASPDYTSSLDAVCARLGVNLDHGRLSPRERVFERGLAALGWHVDRMPRNVSGCDQGESCGFCAYGCRLDAKQSATATWLADAHAAGARILVRTWVERVTVDAGRATGVEARTSDGHAVRVTSRAVVAAGGAIHTPALLRRSGLSNPTIGRHLRLHPVAVVCGAFDEAVRPWHGTMQAIYSDQHARLTGAYGVKYETAALHPSGLAAFAPWDSASEHARLMAGLPHMVPIGVLLRDRDGGTVHVDRHGRPRVRYQLSDFDLAHLRIGVDGAAQILEAAGARLIFSSHTRAISYEPGRRRDRTSFMAAADAWGWRRGRCVLHSFHIMGSARMGGSASSSACDPTGRTWEVRDLYVCDASTFPTASGVNPMIAIEAIAHMNARRIADRFR
jgi:choline dehydrogenase-like flavoprotein